MKKREYNYVYVFIGLMLLGVGLYLTKAVADPQGVMRALPFVMIGLGCGIFGQSVAGVIERYVYKKYPERQKQKEIEVNDERNREIITRAKAKAYDTMVFVFGALMISFALMNVDVAVILLVVFAYLFVVGSSIYYNVKFEKEL